MVSFVGAGNYATSVLIPAFKAAGVRLRCVASSAGVSGVHAGRKYGFEETTTDTGRMFADAGTDAVVITTRHDSHARFVLEALKAGKHVFVEKPLCLTLDELAEIEPAVGVAPSPGDPLGGEEGADCLRVRGVFRQGPGAWVPQDGPRRPIGQGESPGARSQGRAVSFLGHFRVGIVVSVATGDSKTVCLPPGVHGKWLGRHGIPLRFKFSV